MTFSDYLILIRDLVLGNSRGWQSSDWTFTKYPLAFHRNTWLDFPYPIHWKANFPLNCLSLQKRDWSHSRLISILFDRELVVILLLYLGILSFDHQIATCEVQNMVLAAWQRATRIKDWLSFSWLILWLQLQLFKVQSPHYLAIIYVFSWA